MFVLFEEILSKGEEINSLIPEEFSKIQQANNSALYNLFKRIGQEKVGIENEEYKSKGYIAEIEQLI